AFQNFPDDLNSPKELASLIFDEDQKGNLTDVLVSSYTASLAFSNESYRFMFDRLLAGKAPLLFHCSNGKDRTGVAAMLILLALGVDEEAVKADFLLSNESRKGVIEGLMKKYEVFASRSDNARSFFTMIGGVLPESADMMMSEILERYGTYENYMEQEYGFDEEILARFRDMYLEAD
ncbi:MAG: tyrosine-protein phosphatase, partial [Lachnospiraceae bacterium]|nr:tyrosine-protein phosphatase [Lachnospiraceae bacterium]